MKTLIIAQNHRVARFYAQDNNLKTREWTFVDSASRLMGVSKDDARIVMISGWENSNRGKEWEKAMNEVAHSYGIRGVEIVYEDM